MSKKERTRENRMKHLFALQHLTGEQDILKVSELEETLQKIERKLHRLAERECNGEVDTEKSEKIWDKTEKQLKELLPNVEGIVLNGDPRGYALKIDDKVMREKYRETGLQTDWGGYGILAPDYNF